MSEERVTWISVGAKVVMTAGWTHLQRGDVVTITALLGDGWAMVNTPRTVSDVRAPVASMEPESVATVEVS